MTTTLDRVRKVLVEHLGVTPEQATEAASLIDDLGADSFDTIELAMCIEEEFDIELLDDHIELMKTPADIVRIVDNIEEEALK